MVICTTDFTHAFIANWALNRNLHVYLEKPLGITVEEARVVRANWLPKRTSSRRRSRMQRHAHDNFNRIAEMLRDGAVGELKSAYAWGNRKIPKPGYLPAAGAPPDGLHYDLWARPGQDRPPLQPRVLRQGGRELPAVEHVLGLRHRPDRRHGQPHDGPPVERGRLRPADLRRGQGRTPEPRRHAGQRRNALRAPRQQLARGPIGVSCAQGGAMPNPPSAYVDIAKIGHGAMFKGSEGILVADFTSRALIPLGKDGSLTYYKPRKERGTAVFGRPLPEAVDQRL